MTTSLTDKIKPALVLACAATFIGNATAKNQIAPEFTLPQMVENKNPEVLKTVRASYNPENWVYLNFKVDSTGKLSDHKVLRRSNHQAQDTTDFIARTLKYMDNVQYSPATLNDVAAEGHVYVLKTERIAVINASNTQVSRQFKRGFNSLREQFASGNIRYSQVLIRELEEQNRWMSEEAWLAWAKASLHRKNNEMNAYYRDTEVAVLLAEQSLPPPVTARVLVNLFDYQVENHLLADAFNTIQKMQQSPKIIISDERVAIFQERINAKRRQRQPFSIEHTLDGQETFYHNVYSDGISVTLLSGEITDAQMRCIGSSNKADVKVLNQNKHWEFNNHYPQCAVFISGTEDTRIQIRGSWQQEQGNLWVVQDNISRLNQKLSRFWWIRPFGR